MFLTGVGPVGWLIAIGTLLFGVGWAIWGFTEFPRFIAIWVLIVPGAVILAIALGVELQLMSSDKRRSDYVFIVDGDIINNPGEPPAFSLVLKNIGQENADELTWVANFSVGQPKAQPSLGNPSGISKQTLPPGQTLFYKSTFADWNPTWDDLIQKNMAVFFAIGEVRYKDATGAIHLYNYKLISGGSTGLPSGISPGKWGAAPEQ